MPETALDSLLTPQVKTILSDPVPGKGLGPREVVHFLSVDNVDRSGEVVVADGGIWADYDASPVVTFSHSERNEVPSEFSLPVGVTLWHKVADHPNGGKGVLVKTLFDDDEFALRVCAKYKAKVPSLTSWSLTFRPVPGTYGPPTAAEIAARPDWAKAKRIYRKWWPLASSSVLLPDNPNCVTISKSIFMGERPSPSLRRAPMPHEPPVTREAFVASRPELAELIDGIAGATPLLDALGTSPPLVAKGALLGDLRKPALSAVIERYSDTLRGYLWGLVYSSQLTGEELGARVKGAFDEARDALAMAFTSAEDLRDEADATAVIAPQIGYMSRGLSVEAKALFGDPAEGWPVVTEATAEAEKPDPVPDETVEPEPVAKAASADEAPDEDEDVPAPVGRHDHVRCSAPHAKGCGVVKSVHRGEVVPDVDEDIYGTKDEPAVRVKMCKQVNGGCVGTDIHKGMLVKHVARCDPNKPAKRKPKPAEVVDKDEPAAKGWSDVDRARYKASRLNSPAFMEELERRVAERFDVVVLGRV